MGKLSEFFAVHQKDLSELSKAAEINDEVDEV